MKIVNKILVSTLLISSSLITAINMNASNQYDLADNEKLKKLDLISTNLNEQEIGSVSFMNEQVDINSCKEVFSLNDFSHYQYKDCSKFTEVLYLNTLDKLEEIEINKQKNIKNKSII
jgi:hypothetical protein